MGFCEKAFNSVKMGLFGFTEYPKIPYRINRYFRSKINIKTSRSLLIDIISDFFADETQKRDLYRASAMIIDH